ncbi:hypothetical protein MTY59_24210 [Mycobacterium senriense]|uniref:CSD domain-containing protein n=1 Tax=Mycobacterium senriense TaxID=2775496 RepID=A0ABN6IH96_9MYCO|nr:hypothetical protein MTY59_24210 [Mycobacterium senriense]
MEGTEATADNETARQRYATIRSGGALPGAKPSSRAIEVRAVATPVELALFGSGTCASYCACAQSNGSTTTKVSGFIAPDGGAKDVSAHHSDIQGDDFRSPEKNQRVQFDS